MNRFHRPKAAALAAGFLCIAASPAQAQERDSAPQVDELLRCRAVAEPQARLRCFDTAAEALNQGIASGAVLAVDRQRTRRRMFGLAIPDFLGGDNEPAAREMSAKIASSGHSGYQRWTLTLDNGQVWRTTETSRNQEPPPAGTPVRVTREALGNHWMHLPNNRAVRVRRDQ